MSAILMFLLFIIIFMNKTGGHFASCRQHKAKSCFVVTAVS